MADKVVLDSNIFVAAAFNKRSNSAQLIAMARQGRLRLMWHRQTREETRIQLEKIPPISWQPFADLFDPRNEIKDDLPVDQYAFIPDPDDRKFAALAEKAQAVLVTNDQHLLSVAGRLGVEVLTAGGTLTRFGKSRQ